MPANSPGFIWVMVSVFELLGGREKGHDIPVYICHKCGFDFRFRVCHDFPIPFCIFCNSENIEQTGVDKTY